MTKIIHELYKAISAVCSQKFVYITWSHDQNWFTKVMTRIIYKAIYALKGLKYKAIFDEIVNNTFMETTTTLVENNFKYLEGRACLLALKKECAMYLYCLFINGF